MQFSLVHVCKLIFSTFQWFSLYKLNNVRLLMTVMVGIKNCWFSCSTIFFIVVTSKLLCYFNFSFMHSCLQLFIFSGIVVIMIYRRTD